MAKKRPHLKQATRNRELTILIGERNSKYLEWVIIAIFYEAVHHIEAAFACMPRVGHSDAHRKRNDTMSHARWNLIKKSFNKDVASSFDKLENASKSVRYLIDNYQYYYSKSVIGDFIDKDLKLIVQEASKIYT